ncbi:MAG: cob(I)yrinic acid a,c-diamide adenosyltransferase [Endomicrobia bacterium]|nr:cob(I)yrinic acid a,c-diamide adenosyltransferase [Endomicrobiia bacterium]
MIIVNTGDGKGKTTASIGQIVRALGHGFKVCLIQLFKGEVFYGEQNILTKLEGLDFFSYAKKHPYCIKGVALEQVNRECIPAMEKLAELADSPKKYDMVVLEEFNIALRDGFIDKASFLELIKKLSQKSDIVVTGRSAPMELVEMADLVAEMREIKHPYQKGIAARRGIEF